jgi:hypothetical protein
MITSAAARSSSPGGIIKLTDAAGEILKKVRRHRAGSLKSYDRRDIRLPHEGTNRICISGCTREKTQQYCGML